MLDIRKQLLQETSRFNADYIAHEISGDKEKFAVLMNIYLDGEDPFPQKAAWVAEIVSSIYPELIQPYLKQIVKKLPGFTHPGSRRNALKILMRTEIPEKLQGPLIDICFQWLSGNDQPVAIKVYAMQIIENHLKLYPELAYELREVIEDQWERNSVGFKSRGRMVLRGLGKYG
ncbi:MAG: hypothetical protein K9H49_04620 [Bacteroidales bacterium]|nr:hypothetical protein [Bacteroidales bacterium]MCF8389099.1 hypothetical protein [Bacteroidales bacterium]